MIEPGHLVKWSPAQEHLHRMFHRNAAFRFYQRVPITGILKRVDGNGGLLSCMAPDGKKEEIPVLLTELIPVGVAHAE